MAKFEYKTCGNLLKIVVFRYGFWWKIFLGTVGRLKKKVNFGHIYKKWGANFTIAYSQIVVKMHVFKVKYFMYLIDSYKDMQTDLEKSR